MMSLRIDYHRLGRSRSDVENSGLERADCPSTGNDESGVKLGRLVWQNETRYFTKTLYSLGLPQIQDDLD